MKKEQKRYFLVEYYGTTTCLVNNMQEVKHVLNVVHNYNRRKSSEFLYGNITIEIINNKYLFVAHKYTKYTDRMTIRDIDKLTSDKTETDLAFKFKNKSKMNYNYDPDINIAYFESKSTKDLEPGEIPIHIGIKYLPVLYKNDTQYMDKSYIKKCLMFHCQTKDFKFFRDLAEEFETYHFVSDKIGDLRTIINKCETIDENLNSLFMAACELYNKFICEYEKDESLSRDANGSYIISQRRLRDFGFFVKNYGIRRSRLNSPLCYNKPLPKDNYYEQTDGQFKLKLKF